MQKWEYLRLYSSRDFYQINEEKEAKYKTGENLYIILNQFGKDGWELVNRDGNVYMFKRPLKAE